MSSSSGVDLSEGDSNLSRHRRAWAEAHIDPETRAWLDRDAASFIHQTLSTPCLNVLERCSGSLIQDDRGRTYLDFHGNSVHQVGFAHPAVVAAIKQQLDCLPFCTRRYTNRPAIQLAEKLAALAPGDLCKVLFAPGGTTAVGLAVKLARAATGRYKTISMWDAFHGASLDVMSISGESMFRTGVGPLMPGAQLVPPAEPYRCLWSPSGRCDPCDLRCADYIDYVLEKEGDVAAVVAEPVRNTAINPPPDGYWQAVRAACDRRGALLIFDETAVCLGRTGRMFACEHFDGVVPDILTLGKGLGGGMIPLAAMIARPHLDVAPEKGLGHYTHEKNPLACSAALATLHVIEEEQLVQRSCELGRHVLGRLRGLMARFPLIGDVRGLGLLLAVELVTDRKTKARASDQADRLMYHCLSHGLSFKTSQGNIIPLSPPLNISESDLDRALEILEAGLLAVG